ncbi:OLC1v1019425C1 [Oldenlandia corymbosa var. corymbosa]|uniref:OLC1v1019425C1 n=1 Tax=Oldenlandia corymbosa var. corymbosa TaxID=529605 RepID=A0AAV1EE13_OLDCO|nr:OLC1v1019425C1 [Oldenlandia corymbosa var. corymbosa]
MDFIKKYDWELERKRREDIDYLRKQPNKNEVALKLAKPIILDRNKLDNNVNSVFSPLSFHVLLGMLAASSGADPTGDPILAFLKSKSVDELNSVCSLLVNYVLLDDSLTGGPILSSANGIWQSAPSSPDTKALLEAVYKGQFRQADFINKAQEVAREVNEWVENETKGLVRNILPPGAVGRSTKLIVANALYFNGVWTKPFGSSATTKREFFLSSGGSVMADFMTGRCDQYISEYDGFKVFAFFTETAMIGIDVSPCTSISLML